MDSGSDRQPVQLTQHRCYVLGCTSTRDCTSQRVLETLKFVDVAFRCSVQQTVAIVNTRSDQSGCNGHGRIVVDELPDVAKWPDVIWTENALVEMNTLASIHLAYLNQSMFNCPNLKKIILKPLLNYQIGGHVLGLHFYRLTQKYKNYELFKILRSPLAAMTINKIFAYLRSCVQ